MKLNRTFSIVLAASAASGCMNLAPSPLMRTDATPDQLPVSEEAPATSALYDWNEVIQNDRLRQLIETALVENRDLRIAAANVRIARASANATASQRLPTIGLSGSSTLGETFEDPGTFIANSAFNESHRALLGLTSYEVDLFGRVANLSESSFQTYLSSLEGARSAQISIISSVAQTWLALAADQQLLELAESTVEVQTKSLELTTELFDAGVTTELAKRQASASVETARAQAAQFRALVRRDLNLLQLLVGAPLPEGIEKEASLDPAPVKLSRPVGQDSAILLKRPDVMAAERSLAAARADVGAARAAFFPSISLTSNAGYVSADLGDLFNAGSGGWSFGPSISLPLFDAGRRKAGLEAANAAQELALAQYEKAIQSAFRDVADALAVADTIDERLDALGRLTEDTEVTFRLSEERFKVGVDNYLSVLDAQRSDYAARQQYIAAQLEQAINVVDLYRALGAGPTSDGAQTPE